MKQAASKARAAESGKEHWVGKGRENVRLFLWQKLPAAGAQRRGTVLFVHGSSMASQPTFDLKVPGRPDSSVMDWFAARGFETWCMDNEGYGRSDKSRPINCDIANGADDLAAGSEYILETSGAGKLLVYGISSGALRAALFAQAHPERVARLALDAFVWTGEGSPTLAERRKKLPEFSARNRRPIDRAFVHSIFERDHPGTADKATIDVRQVADQPRAFVAEEIVDADRCFLGVAGTEDDRSARRGLADASGQRRAAYPVGDKAIQALGGRRVGDHG